MWSDFTTRYIGAYYRSGSPPNVASPSIRRHIEQLRKHHYVPTKARENSWRDKGRKLEERRRFRSFAMLRDLAFLSLRYRGPAAWDKLVRVE